jgi:hypothetical protein
MKCAPIKRGKNTHSESNSARAAEHVFNYSERELVGRPLSVVLPSHHALVQPRCHLIHKKVCLWPSSSCRTVPHRYRCNVVGLVCFFQGRVCFFGHCLRGFGDKLSSGTCLALVRAGCGRARGWHDSPYDALMRPCRGLRAQRLQPRHRHAHGRLQGTVAQQSAHTTHGSGIHPLCRQRPN